MKLSQMYRIAFSEIYIFLPPVLFHTFVKIRELRLLKNLFSDSIRCVCLLYSECILPCKEQAMKPSPDI